MIFIKQKLLSALKLFTAAILFGFPFIAQAATDPSCAGLLSQFTSGGGNVGTKVVEGLPQICSAQQLILQAINIGMFAAGGIAVLFIMVGGYWYLTSAGNEEQAEKGRKTLVNSIIGLVVIIMAAVIVRIVAQTLQANVSGGGGAPPGNPSGANPPNDTPGLPGFDQAVINLGKGITFVPSSSVSSSETLKIYAAFDSGDEPSMKAICGGVGFAGAGLLGVIWENKDGSIIKKEMPLAPFGTAFSAEVDILPNSLLPGSVVLTVEICQVTIASKQITVLAP